eukprot:Hpha_TRINITY_DN10167_c0_g1::TRINITY_DN10167_c0_g1_i3::g.131457::m.131457/K16575/ACTR1, ARP1; centractin
MVLAPIPQGRPTGTVLDVGHSGTRVTCVLDGIPGKTLASPVGGRDVTAVFEALGQTALGEQGFSGSFGHAAAEDLKRRCSEVAVSAAAARKGRSVLPPEESRRFPVSVPGTGRVSMYLPDALRLSAAESLFAPPQGRQGVSELLQKSAARQTSGPVILVGGGTWTSGFSARVRGDVNDGAGGHHNHLIVSAPRDRENAAWRGGALAAGMDQFTLWFSKVEYDEAGPAGAFCV